jgi:hypothetical protein
MEMITNYSVRIKRCWPGVKNGQVMSVSARRRARLLALDVAEDAAEIVEDLPADPQPAAKRRGRPPKTLTE